MLSTLDVCAAEGDVPEVGAGGRAPWPFCTGKVNERYTDQHISRGCNMDAESSASVCCRGPSVCGQSRRRQSKRRMATFWRGSVPWPHSAAAHCRCCRMRSTAPATWPPTPTWGAPPPAHPAHCSSLSQLVHVKALLILQPACCRPSVPASAACKLCDHEAMTCQ